VFVNLVIFTLGPPASSGTWNLRRQSRKTNGDGNAKCPMKYWGDPLMHVHASPSMYDSEERKKTEPLVALKGWRD